MWDKMIIHVNDKTYTATIKHYEEPSEFGIDGGRISKLLITQGSKTVVNYDRGWDIKPETPEEIAAYETALGAFN